MKAIPRNRPYIWVTWLSQVMAYDDCCQWQYWFQSHHRLKMKQPPDPMIVEWQRRHSQMLSELRQEVDLPGVKTRIEPKFSMHVADGKATLGGQIDCFTDDGNELRIYDCKSGKERFSHQIQVMIYMHVLSTYPQFAGRPMRGYVQYLDKRIDVPEISSGFLSYFRNCTALLADESPAPKKPGRDCRYCNITIADCPDRLEQVDDLLPTA